MKLDFQTDSFAVSEFTPAAAESLSSDRIGVEEKLQSGIKAAREGDRGAARILLLQAAEIEPENEEAWLWLASISEYPEELLVFLNNVLQINPENERANIWAAETKSVLSKSFAQRGIDALKEKHSNFARQCFLQAIASDPENETAWLWLASVSDAVEEKISYLEKVLTLNPENETAQSSLKVVRKETAQSLLPQAIGEAFAGEKTPALETLENIIMNAPENEEAWLLKSFLVEPFAEKITCLERVLEINSNNKTARANHNFLLSMKTKLKAVKENNAEDTPVVDETAFRDDEFPGEFSEREASAFTENKISDGETREDFAVREDKISGNASDSRLEAEFQDEPNCRADDTDESLFGSTATAVAEEIGYQDFDATEPLNSEIGRETDFAPEEPETSADFDDDSQIFDVPELPENSLDDSATSSSDEFANIYAEYGDENAGELPGGAKDNVGESQRQPVENNLPSYYESEESISLDLSAESAFGADTTGEKQNVSGEIQPEENEFSQSVEEQAEQPVDLSPDFQIETTPLLSEKQSDSLACPFCAGANGQQALVCGWCGAALSLSDLEMLLAHRGGDAEIIRNGVEEMEKTADLRELNADELKFLGIGHINLKDFRYGFSYLQEAAQANPNDVVFGSQVNALAIRLAEIEAQTNAVGSSLKNKTILVVDDSATVRKLIAGKLEKCGHAVICAADGVEALEKIKEITPDLVLLDIMMPQMDGYQVCKLIRADENTRDVPVVMISGKDGFFDKVRGRMVGTTGYITKPFGPETLMKTIESYIPQNSQPD